jgi:hypothetical protein
MRALAGFEMLQLPIEIDFVLAGESAAGPARFGKSSANEPRQPTGGDCP